MKIRRNFIFAVFPILFGINLTSYAIAHQPNRMTDAPAVYKVIKGEVIQEDSLSYFHQLLMLALDTTVDEYGAYQLENVDFHTPQYRTLKLLNLPNTLDITYSMTSLAREREFIAIKIPLLKGLFGKRRLLVMQKDKEKFELMSEGVLKTMVACQGMHWPDTAILQKNNYQVYGVIDFEANLKMLMKGRCDYFPRGIHEIDIDLNKLNSRYPEIVAVESLLLKYNAPVYFFVGKQNKALATRIEQGLNNLLLDGSMDSLFNESKFSRYDQSLELKPKLRVFHLANTL